MNNDRFKFRVWKPDWKQYDNDNYLSQDGVLVYAEVDGDGYSGLFCDGDDGVIEQCTGIKDFFGCLIYEGDILKDSEGSDTLTIVYQNGALGYVWAKQFHPMPPWIKNFVVIGNIHEANGAHGANEESEDKHE